MGDRSQVAIKQHDDSKVFLYSHWDGSGIYKKLQASLKRGADRWDDSEYLARIIFDDLIGKRQGDLTGYGITTYLHDDVEHAVPVLDCETKMISFLPCGYSSRPVPGSLSFEQFCHISEEHFENW